MFLLSQNLCLVVRKNSRISITLWKANLLMVQEGEFGKTVIKITSAYCITAIR